MKHLKTLVLYTVFLAFFSGCLDWKSLTPSFSNAPEADTSLKVGSRPFLTSNTALFEFLIMREDPETHTRWSARFKQTDPGLWQIASGPDDQPLVDTVADSSFINHLLETLKTLEIAEMGSQGELPALGLSPPLFALQWKTIDSGDLPPKQSLHELQVGLQKLTTKAVLRYALFPQLAPTTRAFLVEGATLAMLDYIKSFDTLRRRRLSTWETDQVAQFQVFNGLRQSLYAERVSGEWGNEKHQIWVGPVGEWIERLNHLMIEKFNDKVEDSARLYERVLKIPAYSVVIKDLQGQTCKIAIALEKGIWWGVTSSRPGAAFRMDKDIAGYFLGPRVILKKVSRPTRRSHS